MPRPPPPTLDAQGFSGDDSLNFNDIATRFYGRLVRTTAQQSNRMPLSCFRRSPSDRHLGYVDSVHCRRTTRRISLSRPADKAILSGGFGLSNDLNAFSWMNASSEKFFYNRSISHRASCAQSTERASKIGVNTADIIFTLQAMPA